MKHQNPVYTCIKHQKTVPEWFTRKLCNETLELYTRRVRTPDYFHRGVRKRKRWYWKVIRKIQKVPGVADIVPKLPPCSLHHDGSFLIAVQQRSSLGLYICSGELQLQAVWQLAVVAKMIQEQYVILYSFKPQEAILSQSSMGISC